MLGSACLFSCSRSDDDGGDDDRLVWCDLRAREVGER